MSQIRLIRVVAVIGVALMLGSAFADLALGQTRVPTKDVYTLANRGGEDGGQQSTENADSSHKSEGIAWEGVPQPQANGDQYMQLPQAQMIAQQQAIVPQQTGNMPGMSAGPIVIPVTVPQYMTYTPPPVTMVMNRPAQLVIPPYYAMPETPPMYYNPMVQQQMMQQQMAQQQMMQQQFMAQQPMMAPPQPQPIPTKMILPDGSTVSIKHYIPGSFFKNVWRAVTP